MSDRHRFEALVLPHLDSAYNLARWLLRDEAGAEDAVQEAFVRALRYAQSLRGDDARPWLLAIVRNICFDVLERRRHAPEVVDFDEAEFDIAVAAAAWAAGGADPAELLQQRRLKLLVDSATRALAPTLREVIVLREFEELAYADIARITGVPLGTVMSRLARARERLRLALAPSRPGAVT